MENKVKYVTENGTFYLDHSCHGMLSVDESDIKNMDALLGDIEKAMSDFKLNKKLTSKRISNIKNLLSE